MSVRLGLLVVGIILGVSFPSPAAAVVRPPTSQDIAAAPVPARSGDPAYARSYFGARYYRAEIGRFTTVDPAMTIKDNLVDSQRWNRYAYVRNNPLRYVDPDGQDIRVTQYKGRDGNAFGPIGVGVNTTNTVGLDPATGSQGSVIESHGRRDCSTRYE